VMLELLGAEPAEQVMLELLGAEPAEQVAE
jgi:hypothetical protein